MVISLAFLPEYKRQIGLSQHPIIIFLKPTNFSPIKNTHFFALSSFQFGGETGTEDADFAECGLDFTSFLAPLTSTQKEI